jgi:lysophospholipase L1-like esterase
MTKMPRLVLAALAALLVTPPAALHAAATTAESQRAATAPLRLTLPPAIYAVPGVEMSVYFSNAILAEATEHFSFAVTCDVGETDPSRWKLNATAQQVGQYPLTLKVNDKSGQLLTQATTQVRVVPADAGRGQDIALLIVGDSLTHASLYPNEIARLLSQPGNPKWQMLGTHKPSAAAANVVHEGYGGWTWHAFNARFDPTRPVPGKTSSSPFVFATGQQQAPTLDVARYIAERCGGRAPDYVTFLLGINDCFRLKADNLQTLDAGITEMFHEADKLLAAFHRAVPRVELGVCLTTPPNIRDAAFVANYKTAYPRWNWRQVQHRIVERQLEHFKQREGEGIFIVPTELNLDIVAGYPDNNAVHPNARGYQQIGASIYSWLKSRLAARDATKPKQPGSMSSPRTAPPDKSTRNNRPQNPLCRSSIVSPLDTAHWNP